MTHHRNIFDLYERIFRKITKFINGILQHKLCNVCLYYNTYNLALLSHLVTNTKVHLHWYIYAPARRQHADVKQPKLIIQRS